MAMTTLHTPSIPTWGMLQFSTRRMGTNPALLSLAVFIHTPPSMSEQPYPSCSGNQSKNQTAITLECQSLDAMPQHTVTTVDLTVLI